MARVMSTEDAFRAVADPARRAILDLLREGERAVTDLLEHFAFSQPALSQHLRVLREAGLVTRRKDGRRRIYDIDALPLRLVHDWAAHYEEFWHDRLDRLGRHLDDEAALGSAPGDLQKRGAR